MVKLQTKKKHLRNEKNKNNILGLASSIGRLAQSAGGLASSARRMKPVRCRIQPVCRRMKPVRRGMKPVQFGPYFFKKLFISPCFFLLKMVEYRHYDVYLLLVLSQTLLNIKLTLYFVFFKYHNLWAKLIKIGASSGNYYFLIHNKYTFHVQSTHLIAMSQKQATWFHCLHREPIKRGPNIFPFYLT